MCTDEWTASDAEMAAGYKKKDFIAAKYEEIFPPLAKDYAYLADAPAASRSAKAPLHRHPGLSHRQRLVVPYSLQIHFPKLSHRGAPKIIPLRPVQVGLP